MKNRYKNLEWSCNKDNYRKEIKIKHPKIILGCLILISLNLLPYLKFKRSEKF